jgi:hypothetical protein
MSPALPLLVTALVGCASPAEKPPANDWHETVLLKEKDLTVRLKVLARASLAETGWMVLEFENRGEKPLTVEDAHYWITAAYGPLGTGQDAVSGSLASGNTYDLFPDACATTPVSPIVLPPGKTYRAVEQPSDYSAALLGLPPPPGRSVRGRAFVAVSLNDRRELRAAEPAGVPFAFDWLHPDDAGFKAMQARLGRLLRSPENRPHHAYLLETYLGIPQVAQVATVDELVTALDRRRKAFEGRPAVAALLAKRFSNDPAVTAYFRRGLKDGDTIVLDDLRHTALWERSDVKPLVHLYELDPAKYSGALGLLHKYRDDWIKDDEIVRRLTAVVRQQHPVLRQDVRRLEPDGLGDWAEAVNSLSMTGDPSAVALLRPALDDKRSFRSSRQLAMPGGVRLPPLRVCDVALDAILTLLDGSPDEAYRRAGPMPVGRNNLDAAYADLRDRMITELKRRPAVGGKGD